MDIRATKQELLSRINAGWDEFQAFLATLSDEQLTVPTDAGGWTGKDHIIHIAVWEDGMEALLRKESRHGRMGISDAMWEKGDHDEVNATIQQHHKNKSLAEVRKIAAESHQRLLKTIASLSDDELNLPYKHYAPAADREHPVYGWVIGNTYEHYEEHTPWIAAIAEKA